MILASGGLGHLYSATTNPDGLHRRRNRVGFVGRGAGQPTSSSSSSTRPCCSRAAPAGRRPLITEAIRGEGAILLIGQGNSVTAGVHPMGIWLRATSSRRRSTPAESHRRSVRLPRRRAIDGFEARFPTVTAACRAAGIDPVRATHPGRPRSALQLRRRRHRRARPNRAAGAVRRGRGGPHRHARRKPVGVQQLAGRSGGRRPRRKGRSRACRGGRPSRAAEARPDHRTRARRAANCRRR